MTSSLSRLSAGGILLWTAFCLIHFPSSSLAQSDSVVSYPLVPHHQERARRSLQGRSMPRRGLRNEKHLRRRTVEQQVGALFQGYGTHYVDLWVGTPPQRQTVIVDTGSGTTAFPCSECKKCGAGEYHIDQVFDESLSTTYGPTTCTKNKECVSYHSSCKTKNCHITQAYSEGSRWDAVEAIDSCYIGGPHEQPLIKDYNSNPLNPKHASHYAFNLTFGCQYEVTGLFESQLADGILGMNNGMMPYWQQMSDAGKLQEEMFSLCFARQPTAEREGTEAGALSFGGYDPKLHETHMVYTSGASDGRERQWSVKIRKIFLRDGAAGESVKSTKKKVKTVEVKFDNQLQGIVDSGTTDSFLPSIIAESFKDAYEQMTGQEYVPDEPMSLRTEDLEKMPTVILQLVSSSGDNSDKDYKTPGLAGKADETNPYDVMLAIPPSHYMEYDDEADTYSARLHLDKSGESFTLGANAMMGHDVLFDLENDRIGWAESSCNYTELVVEGGFKFTITGEMQEPAGEDEDEDADADADGDSDSDADADSEADNDAHADSDADTDVDAHADSDADTDAHADSDSDADTDADEHADVDVDTDFNATDVDLYTGNATDVDIDVNATEVDVDGTNATDVGIDANSTDADLDGTNATDVEIDANSTDADLDGTNATDVEIDANSTDADLDGTNVTDVDIDVNTTDANLDGTNPMDVDIDVNATEVGVHGTNATDIDIDVNATDADLNGTNEVDGGEGFNATEVDEDTDEEDGQTDEDADEGEGQTDEYGDADANEGPGGDEDPTENTTWSTTPGTSPGSNTNATIPGKWNEGPDSDLEQEYGIMKEPNTTNPGKLHIDPDSDLEQEYEVLKETEDVDVEDENVFVGVDCHEEMIDRASNITMDRVKNETVVAYCKVKNSANKFKDLCDSPECQIPVLVGLIIAVIAGMCLCSLLRCFCYYLFCCCCCKKDKGPKYQGLGTDEVDGVGGYRDEPEEPRGKKKYRDNVASKKKKGTSLSRNDGAEFI